MATSLPLATGTTSLVPVGEEWTTLQQICTIAIQSGLLPDQIKNIPQAIAIALKGRELGIPPMYAFTHINVIQGKTALSPELMLALIFKKVPGAKVDFIERSDKACRIVVQRPGQKEEAWAFTFEDAKQLGLASKDNYRKQPATMLQWRCIGQMARAKFPDILMGGSYTPEELGAEVDDEGNVIDIPKSADTGAAPESFQHEAAPVLLTETKAPEKEIEPVKKLDESTPKFPTEMTDEELKASAEYQIKFSWPKSGDRDPYQKPLKFWRRPDQTGYPYLPELTRLAWEELEHKIYKWARDAKIQSPAIIEFQTHFQRYKEYFDRHQRKTAI